MDDNRNIVSFPENPRDRRRLRNSRTDRRLRVVSRLRQIFGWLLLLSVVVFFASNASLLSLDSLRRIPMLFQSSLSASADGNVLTFDGGPAVDAAGFAGGLAVANSDTVSLCRPGSAGQSIQLAYTTPVLQASDNYILAYDQGGLNASLLTALSQSSSQTLKSPILSGSVSASGNYALLTDESGYRAAATVFSPDGTQIFKWATPDYYFLTSALSPGGNLLAISVFRQSGTETEGLLFLRDITKEDAVTEVSLGSTLGLAVSFLSDDTLAVIGDNRCLFISRTGNILSETTYNPDDLTAFAFGDGQVALCLRAYSGNARALLTVLSPDGSQLPEAELSEEPQSLSFAGHRLAVLTAGGLYCFSSDLEPLWKNQDAAAASRAILNDDGSVWVLSSRQAVRYTSSSEHSEEFTHA